MDIGTDRLAEDIKSCESVDMVKQKFGITKDLTEEEQREILNEIMYSEKEL